MARLRSGEARQGAGPRVASDALVSRAVAVARTIAPDSLDAYARIKADLLAPALERIAAGRAHIDREFLDVWFSDAGRRRMGEVRARLLARHH